MIINKTIGMYKEMFCECGCGEQIEPFDVRGRPRRFKHGHCKIGWFNRGERPHNWKGGKRDKDGYVYIWNPTHPYSNNLGYVFKHRLVMESYLGKYLEPTDIIHHINGIVDDNRIENLQLLTKSEHMRYHGKLRYPHMILDNGKFKRLRPV
jgi:HNH endonuclease